MVDVILKQTGSVGHIILNRPHALNALTHQMCLDIEVKLLEWRDDPEIVSVFIEGSGERAFCAGGDITQLYSKSLEGNHDYGKQFWKDEYRLNALIANYPKPYVAFLDGIVMGGGVGISMHGSLRLVTDKTLFAMPECSIGLIPDVGGSLLLANAQGHLGEYLGLTGARIGASDCIYAGLADVYLSETQKAEAIEEFLATGDPEVIQKYAEETVEASLSDQQENIDKVFSSDTISEFFSLLKENPNDWSNECLKNLERAAPLSLLIALDVIRTSRRSGTIEAALLNEFRFVSRCTEHSEFIEGIRAAVIDKDRNPNWRFKSVNDVPEDLVKTLRAPAIGGDLIL